MHQDALRQRLATVTRALAQAGIPYAVIGGDAVAHYVSLVDPDAVRSTADVDLLMNAGDMERAAKAIEPEGFRYRVAAGDHMFLDTPSARSGVHVLHAGKRVRPEYLTPAPDLETVEHTDSGIAIIPFARLVAMKLTSFRLKDQVHLQDMIGVGLLPGAVMETLPPHLRERLQYLMDHPE